jgi:senataxin
MPELIEELAEKFAEFQQIPKGCHLLCAKVSEDDEEDYRRPSNIGSSLSVDERKKRIEDGDRRIELTFWNSLVFGFDKKDAGKWAEEFRSHLDLALKHCSDCVLNWHMKRVKCLQKFSE